MRSPAVLCFSHLRWDFVYQRPNHLMSRCARKRRVFFVEEPVHDEGPFSEITQLESMLYRVVPHVSRDASLSEQTAQVRGQILALCQEHRVRDPIMWFYTPMAVPVTRGLRRSLTVYDCMDELSAFRNAPPEMALREQELMVQAEVMFTGGKALYEEKRTKHRNVHPMPSSVDVPFFARARTRTAEPADQALIPCPRVGYYGVIDERMDLSLLAKAADARPGVQFVMIGPVVKIAPEDLPRRRNIRYLGPKKYEELPRYVAHWDVAMMPFALNDSTRFISPTKTPEYLAAGKPVVSTAIRDVVEPYERLGLVRIAADADQFVNHVDAALLGDELESAEERDAFLARNSWDRTWERMEALMESALGMEVPSEVLGSEPAVAEQELPCSTI